MTPSPRILFVAEPSAAVEALRAVREGGEAQAQLAPDADVLRDTLMAPDAADAWDAVVFVPGGPVEEVEVAVFVPDGLPLFVVGNDVPLLLSETAAVALPEADLPGLLVRLAATERPSSPEPLDAPPDALPGTPFVDALASEASAFESSDDVAPEAWGPDTFASFGVADEATSPFVETWPSE